MIWTEPRFYVTFFEREVKRLTPSRKGRKEKKKEKSWRSWRLSARPNDPQWENPCKMGISVPIGCIPLIDKKIKHIFTVSGDSAFPLLGELQGLSLQGIGMRNIGSNPLYTQSL